jgi:hypothetical protein
MPSPKLTLVFEFLDQDLKKYLDVCENGMEPQIIKWFLFQLLQVRGFWSLVFQRVEPARATRELSDARVREKRHSQGNFCFFFTSTDAPAALECGCLWRACDCSILCFFCLASCPVCPKRPGCSILCLLVAAGHCVLPLPPRPPPRLEAAKPSHQPRG